MLDVLTIGSGLLDIFVTSDQFDLQRTDDSVFLCQLYGAKLELNQMQLCSGGGASNVAVGVARAGLSAGAIVELGKDSSAHLVLHDLEQEHVNTSYVIHERKEQTGGSVILVGHDGGRTVMVHRGASSMLDPDDIDERAIARTNWVHLSSIAGRQATLQHIFRLVKRHNKRLSWNPGSGELAILAAGELALDELPVQTLLMNQEEWAQLEPLQQQLVARIPVVIVTAGQHGITVFTEGTQQQLPAVALAQVVDETGAGDAFCSGYIAATLNQLPVLEACHWGLRNGASVVSHLGAKPGLLTEQQLSQPWSAS